MMGESGQWRARAGTGRLVGVAALLLVIALFVSLNVNWMERYRFGGVLDIDEAGYLGYSTAYAKAWVGGGLKAWLNAVNAPGAHAPLLPALTSFLLAYSDFSLDIGILSNTFVACALIVVVPGLCWLLGGGAPFSIVAGVFLATLPAVVDYSRNYQFALLASLFYVGGATAIVRSKGFSVRSWSVWAGVFVGLMILSRTMTIAFLPCFGLMALFAIWAHGGLQNKVVWRNMGWAALAFFLVSLTWYARHYRAVFEYLFSFGYGAHAAEYGKNVEEGYLQFFLARMRSLMGLYLRPYHFFVLVPLFLLTSVVSMLAMLRPTVQEKWRCLATGAVLVVSSFLVLSSSKNQGSGFELPLICAAVAIAFGGAGMLVRSGRWAAMLAGLALTASVPFFYSQTSVEACSILPNKMQVPYFGKQRPFDCRGTIHEYVAGDGELVSAPDRTDVVPLSALESQAWRKLSADVASHFHGVWNGRSLVMFGTRNYLFNVNTVNLEMLALSGEALPAVQIEPTLLRDDPAEYKGWVSSGISRGACIALTSGTGQGEFRPKPAIALLTQELRSAGFVEERKFDLPGSKGAISFWQRDAEQCWSRTRAG